jgi:thiol-disulfide isomerase/thioredoxin
MKFIYTSFILIILAVATLSFTSNDTKTNTSVKDEALEWHTNFAKANELSKETGKPIFAFFTGSDWCGWCKRLQTAVFVKPAFVTWASEKVILLELDFPRRTQLPDSLKQQNQQLAGVFQVKGYPTCWLFETTKNEETNQVNIVAFGSLGYPSGAVKGKEEDTFIASANEILANKK